MEELIILALGILQGITEFLPISSSAHLVIFPQLLNEQPYGLFVDATLHLATMSAVTIYFFDDVKKCAKNAKLISLVVVATLPLFLFGAFVTSNMQVEQLFKTPLIVALASIVFAIILYIAEKKHNRDDCLMSHNHLSLKNALYIGLFQALAVIPGVSRMGACLSMCYFMKLTRTEALRFTFLLAIPAILGAFLFEAYSLTITPSIVPEIWVIVSAFLLAFLTAIFIIHFLFKTIEKITMLPFVIYRIVFGVGVILFFVI